MQSAAFKVILKEVFSEARLLKGGWQIEQQDLYSKVKDEFKYFYSITRIGKISLANIQCVMESTYNRRDFSTLGEFNFEKAWSTLWGASFYPGSVEILLRNNIMNTLLEAGFKPAVMGVIEFKGQYNGHEQDISYYYPSPEHSSLYKLVDENPMDAMDFVKKLKVLGILQAKDRVVSTQGDRTETPKVIQKHSVSISASSLQIEDQEDVTQVMTLKEFKSAEFEDMEKYYGEYLSDNILGIAYEDMDNGAVFFKALSYKGNILEG